MRLILAILLLIPSFCQANLKDNLIGWWKLDESSGTSAYDSSYQGSIGTLTNTPTISTDCPRFNCLRFVSASSQYVTMGNLSLYDFTGATSFSVSLWAKQNAAASEIAISKSLASGAGWFLASSATGVIRFVGRNGSANSIDVNTTSAFWSTPVWVHVVVTYNGSRSASGVKIYVNGVSATLATAVDTNTLTWANAATFQISGRDSTGTLGVLWNGQIDDARIYNRIITDQEILDLYNSPRLGYVPGT